MRGTQITCWLVILYSLVVWPDACDLNSRTGARIMRYELADYEWAAIKPMLPNKPRDVPRVNDRRVLNCIFWVLRSGAPWRDLPEAFGPATTASFATTRPRAY